MSLHPVEAEGKGQVLLDVGTDKASESLEELRSSTAGKRRRGKKNATGGRTSCERKLSLHASTREGAPLD
jgi:hypothetical protein